MADTYIESPSAEDIAFFDGSLTYIEITEDCDFSTDFVKMLAQGFPNLEEIYTKVFPAKPGKTLLSSFKKLKKITIAADTLPSASYRNKAPFGAPSTCEFVWDSDAEGIWNAGGPQEETFGVVNVPTTTSTPNPTNYRDAMYDLLKEMREYVTRKNYPSFAMINNGGSLIFIPDEDKNWTDAKIEKLAKLVDGVCIEDLNYGINANYDIADDTETPESIRNEFLQTIAAFTKYGVKGIILDYASTESKIVDGLKKSKEAGCIGSVAIDRNLTKLPNYTFPDENEDAVYHFADLKTYFALLNPTPDTDGSFTDKEDYIAKLSATNIDAMILDIYYGEEILTQDDVNRLKFKPNGKRRQVYCYMSLGEAEDYRPYFNKSWSTTMPDWIAEENKDWDGNYKVKYWTDEWKKVLFGTPNSYLDGILKLGFDGVFLDVIDAYEYFEG